MTISNNNNLFKYYEKEREERIVEIESCPIVDGILACPPRICEGFGFDNKYEEGIF